MNQIKLQKIKGYTLVELMMVIMIISVLASIVMPKFVQLTYKAYQAKGKSNLGNLRSAISIYYSENEGKYPMSSYQNNNALITANQMSITKILTPRYMTQVQIPQLHDGVAGHNGVGTSYDSDATLYMTMSPVQDVFLAAGAPGPIVGLRLPFAYDTTTGLIFYANDNTDRSGTAIYNW